MNYMIHFELDFVYLLYRFLYIVDAGNDRVVVWTSNYAAGGTCIIGCGSSGGMYKGVRVSKREGVLKLH
jgi:hypothetical protein